MSMRELKTLSELELMVLGALHHLGGASDGLNISKTIKAAYGQSAAVGRVYVAVGTLAERGLVRVRTGTARVNGRARVRSFVDLTARASRIVEISGALRNGTDGSTSGL
jgi:hypothetical protein